MPVKINSVSQSFKLFNCSDLPVFLLLNATSLAKQNAKEQLFADILNVHADIALVTESWFTCNYSDDDLGLDGFTLYRRDRPRRKGGGICVYARSSVSCCIYQPANVADCKEVEIMWVQLQYSNCKFFIAVCYHPPKPVYPVETFISQLSDGIDSIISNHADFVLIVAGDFNGLDTDFITNNFGLYQLVKSPTHGSHILDKFFVSMPDIYKTNVFKSLVKTKHMCVMVEPFRQPTGAACEKQERQKIRIYDKRAHNIDRLRYALGTYNWATTMARSGINDIYSNFLDVVRKQLAICTPSKLVSIGHRDPSFITPLIKSLLVKRNRLRRKGRIEESNILADRINALIAENRSSRFAKLAHANSKVLWDAVKGTNKRCSAVHGSCGSLLSQPDLVNQFFCYYCWYRGLQCDGHS